MRYFFLGEELILRRFKDSIPDERISTHRGEQRKHIRLLAAPINHKLILKTDQFSITKYEEFHA
jgi:hypothetical protein